MNTTLTDWMTGRRAALRAPEDAITLAVQARFYRVYARSVRAGSPIGSLSASRCDRSARTLERLVRDIADSYIVDSQARAA